MSARQVHLWVRVDVDDRRPGARLGFASLARLARTAERGLFDALVLGRADRVDTVAVLSGVAAVTDRLGLAAAVDAVHAADASAARAHALARRLASLDHLSAGRAAWQVVAASETVTVELVATCRALWDSWAPDAVVADAERGVFVRRGGAGQLVLPGHAGDERGRFPVPRGPQGHPVLLRPVDSRQGHEADVVLTRPSTMRAGQASYRDVHDRVRRHGPDRPVLVLAEAPSAAVLAGPPRRVAEQLDEYVQGGACDGFVLAADVAVPGALDELVDRVVPELRDRGSYRSEYPGATLRDRLGLRYPRAGIAGGA